jgi:hypothetical protein
LIFILYLSFSAFREQFILSYFSDAQRRRGSKVRKGREEGMRRKEFVGGERNS